MLDDHLLKLHEDINFTLAMDESLATVFDSLNTEQTSLNNELRLLENQLQRKKAHAKASLTYVTREGDTLMKIAELFYGSQQDWRRVYEANKSEIEDPNKPLPPGVELTIPR